MDDIKIAVEPATPTVETLTAELNEALNRFALTYLRLGDMMSHIQSLLQGARTMGKSGEQVAVLAKDIESVKQAYNKSVAVFSKGALPATEQKAVDQMIAHIRNTRAQPPPQ